LQAIVWQTAMTAKMLGVSYHVLYENYWVWHIPPVVAPMEVKAKQLLV